MIGDVPQGHTEDLFCEKTFCASKSEGQVSALRFQWVWQTCWNCFTMIGDVLQGHTEDFFKFCVKTFCARFRSQIPMVWELFHNDRWCTARAHRRFFLGEKTLCASMSEGQVSALRFHRHKTPSNFTYSQIPIGLTTLLALFHDYRWGTCKGIQKIYFVKKKEKKRGSASAQPTCSKWTRACAKDSLVDWSRQHRAANRCSRCAAGPVLTDTTRVLLDCRDRAEDGTVKAKFFKWTQDGTVKARFLKWTQGGTVKARFLKWTQDGTVKARFLKWTQDGTGKAKLLQLTQDGTGKAKLLQLTPSVLLNLLCVWI